MGRYEFIHPADEFEQVRILFRTILTEDERTNLISNICYSLGQCRHDIQRNMLRWFYKVDEEYGRRIEEGLTAP